MKKTITNHRSRRRLRRQRLRKKRLEVEKDSRYQDPRLLERDPGQWLAKELTAQSLELRTIRSLAYQWPPLQWAHKRTAATLLKVISRQGGNFSQQVRGARASSRHQGWLTAQIKPTPPTRPPQMTEGRSRRVEAHSPASSRRPSHSQRPTPKPSARSHFKGQEPRPLEAKTRDYKTNIKLNRPKIHFNWAPHT